MLVNFIGENVDLTIGKLHILSQIRYAMPVELKENVESIVILDRLNDSNTFSFFTYTLCNDGPETEYLEATKGAGDDEVEAGSHWLLPCREFEGLYESLIYEEGLKERFLRLVETTLTFSKKGVNQNIITCNRLALLYGPPGTGKTTLCKAIAQKLAIRMQKHYIYHHLIEINCHSLFSKWFSEVSFFKHVLSTNSVYICNLVCFRVEN